MRKNVSCWSGLGTPIRTPAMGIVPGFFLLDQQVAMSVQGQKRRFGP